MNMLSTMADRIARLRVRTRLGIGFGILLLFLMLVGAAGVGGMHRLDGRVNDMSSTTMPS